MKKNVALITTTVAMLFVCLIVFNQPSVDIDYIQNIIGEENQILKYVKLEDQHIVLFRVSEKKLGFKMFDFDIFGRYLNGYGTTTIYNQFYGQILQISGQEYIFVTGVVGDIESLDIRLEKVVGLEQYEVMKSYNINTEEDYFVIFEPIEASHIAAFPNCITLKDKNGTDITNDYLHH